MGQKERIWTKKLCFVQVGQGWVSRGSKKNKIDMTKLITNTTFQITDCLITKVYKWTEVGPNTVADAKTQDIRTFLVSWSAFGNTSADKPKRQCQCWWMLIYCLIMENLFCSNLGEIKQSCSMRPLMGKSQDTRRLNFN